MWMLEIGIFDWADAEWRSLASRVLGGDCKIIRTKFRWRLILIGWIEFGVLQ
jgi:hypothetical protein